MIRERYLAIIPRDSGLEAAWASRIAPLAAKAGLEIRNVGPCLLASAEAASDRLPDLHPRCAVIGTLVRVGSRSPVDTLAKPDLDAIVESLGAVLISKFWGNYVAFIADADGVRIVRAPFGDIGCYHCETDDAVLVASDIELLESASARHFAIDWHALAAHLVAADIRHAATCLAGVSELAGGDRLHVRGRVTVESLWSPWEFVAPGWRCDDRDAASTMLAQTILDATSACFTPVGSSVLLLSGGVDSSIVAAAAAAAGHRAVAVNMVTNNAAGDERAEARRVAEHCGFELREVVRDVADVDVTRSASARLPYPVDRSFSQATVAAAGAAASDTGADMVIHGGGGDHIFCSLQSAAPLADLLAANGLDRRAPALVRDIAIIAQATSAAVLKQAMARLLWRRPDFRWESKLELLTREGRSFEPGALDHAWLRPPPKTLSGSAGHVALTLGALGVVQTPDALTKPDWHAPLLVQPIVEACLKIPSWLWFEHGRNRAIARHAFAPLLPEAAIRRPTKGAMDSFMIEIFDANRATLRSMLADGALVASGLVDRNAILALLDDPTPVRGTDWSRVLQFADVEAWLSSRR